MITRSDTSPPVKLDRRSARRLETKAEIVAAAWILVRKQGLAALAMRDLGELVGMKAQSIYSYFESKHEIYDAMFREGYEAFAIATGGPGDSAHDPDEISPRDRALELARQFFEFCTSDPVRYQLLFQRTIPGFVPSEKSYSLALKCYESWAVQFASFGITDPNGFDLWTAMLTGLTDQQISNDPGGDRWELILERSVDMVLREIAPHLENSTTRTERT